MKTSRLITFILIALIITDSFTYINMVNELNIGFATYISSFLNYISLIFILYIAKKNSNETEIPASVTQLYKFWLFVIIFNLLRGFFVAKDYWDWKFLLLSSVAFSLVPLAFFLGKNLYLVRLIFKFTISYLFVYGFFFIPISLKTNPELYSRLMIPISLFILFIPYLKFRWRILILIVAIVSILMVINFRSNLIKIAFSCLILAVFYFRRLIGKKIIVTACFALFALPFIFFTLAVTGKYNIFETISKKEGYTTINKEGVEENLMLDTRTFLYMEVISSLKESGNWLWGESGSGSYKSKWFYNDGGAINGKRYRSEVGILNILLYYGVIGVIAYLILLYKVSFMAIKSSKNKLAQMLGLFIAFRWTYSFVEEFSQYDLNFFFFWIAIGLVSSKTFREMSDQQIKSYLLLR